MEDILVSSRIVGGNHVALFGPSPLQIESALLLKILAPHNGGRKRLQKRYRKNRFGTDER